MPVTQATPQVRVWCTFNGATAGTNAPIAGSGVTSVTKVSAGLWTINHADMGAVNFGVSASQNAVGNAFTNATPVSATTSTVAVYQPGGAGAIDSTLITFEAFK
jgi:hypothetical protein